MIETYAALLSKLGAMLQALGVWLTLRDLAIESDRSGSTFSVRGWLRFAVLLPRRRVITVEPGAASPKFRGYPPKVEVLRGARPPDTIEGRVQALEERSDAHTRALDSLAEKLDSLGHRIVSMESTVAGEADRLASGLDNARRLAAGSNFRLNLRGGGLVLTGLLLSFISTPAVGIGGSIAWILILLVVAIGIGRTSNT